VFVTCHPAEVTFRFQPLPQPKLVLDLATPKECKAELTKAPQINHISGITEVRIVKFRTQAISSVTKRMTYHP